MDDKIFDQIQQAVDGKEKQVKACTKCIKTLNKK
ncbi:MAG: hypothetical protein IJ959_03160 [Clostridia bacterium]|nr:hypothetical protein [Clostridia bacterium]